MSSSYLLKNLRIVNPQSITEADLRVTRGSIAAIGNGLSRRREDTVLDCDGLSACPGLVNAHDHLRFNLYPRIGTPPYQNAYEWGDHIHASCRTTIDTIESIPIRLRYRWGAWKNLLSGVTRVVHHDPYSMYCRYFLPVDILAKYTHAHSLGTERNFGHILTRRRPEVPFIIHIAEGIDDRSASEVARLGKLGGLDDRTVAVHAVNINRQDICLLVEKHASVVWCPSSNQYLFGKTAPIESLWGAVPVALGTDSTLTGSTTMFDEMRTAQEMSSRSPQDILRMVTDIPRGIFGFPTGVGEIIEGGIADLFLLPSNDLDPYRAITEANPGLIMLMMREGRVLYHDPARFTLAPEDENRVMILHGRRKVFSGRECVNLVRTLQPFLRHYQYLSIGI